MPKKSIGSPYRTECVRKGKKIWGYREWFAMMRYGRKWKIEGVFSALKQIFGE